MHWTTLPECLIVPQTYYVRKVDPCYVLSKPTSPAAFYVSVHGSPLFYLFRPKGLGSPLTSPFLLHSTSNPFANLRGSIFKTTPESNPFSVHFNYCHGPSLSARLLKQAANWPPCFSAFPCGLFSSQQQTLLKLVRS